MEQATQTQVKPATPAENTPIDSTELHRNALDRDTKGGKQPKSFFKRLFKGRERVSADAGEKNNWKAWLYLAPSLILLAVFTFYPLINTIVIAFLKDYNYVTQTNSGFTLDNFGTVLGLVGQTSSQTTVYLWQCTKQVTDGVTHYYFSTSSGVLTEVYFQTDVIKYALPNTLLITFITVPISIIISLLISIGLNSIKAFKKVLQTIFFVPYVTNAIAVGMQGPSICFFSKATPEQKLAAWLFYKFITNEKNSAIWSVSTGYNPVRTASFSDDIYTKRSDTSAAKGLVKTVADFLADDANHYSSWYYTSPAFKGSSTARLQMGALVGSVMLGTKSVDTAFADAMTNCLFAG